jgi:phosphoribosylglycinamide formyltransferase 1
MDAAPFRIAVLLSGRGSNLQALIGAQRAGDLHGEIVLAASNKIDADGLRLAEEAGIPTVALATHATADRAAYDRDLFARVAQAAPDLIVLAGFMRVLDPCVLAPWHGRMINIHPSLLPKYPGLKTHQRALAARDAEHGASVHFVTPELDGGPVLAQVRVAIEDADTPERLAARLLPLEHRLLPACVALLARRRAALVDDRIVLDGRPLTAPLQYGTTW